MVSLIHGMCRVAMPMHIKRYYCVVLVAQSFSIFGLPASLEDKPKHSKGRIFPCLDRNERTKQNPKTSLTCSCIFVLSLSMDLKRVVSFVDKR